MKKIMWMGFAVISGVTTLSIAMASVPSHGRITDDTAIYQNLSEIRVPRQASPNFDQDIAQLSASEGRYREKLPSLSRSASIAAPLKRISQTQYKYSKPKHVVATNQ